MKKFDFSLPQYAKVGAIVSLEGNCNNNVQVGYR